MNPPTPTLPYRMLRTDMAIALVWAVVLVSSLTIVLLLFYAPSPKSEVVPDPALLCNASLGSAQGLTLPDSGLTGLSEKSRKFYA